MNYILIIIVGFLSGLLYSVNIYARTKKGKNPLLTFPLRLSFTALLMFLIGKFFGAEGVLIFGLSHLITMLGFVAYRTFVKP